MTLEVVEQRMLDAFKRRAHHFLSSTELPDEHDELAWLALNRRRFNHFYRVRRGQDWQDPFYDLLERWKAQPVAFAEVLDRLHESTGRYEASFASKLLATIEPDMPVIDSIVLRNLGLRLPAYSSPERAARIAAVHQRLVTCFASFLQTETGRYLVRRFRDQYPDANVTEVKMLDLVSWQTRGEQPRGQNNAPTGRSAVRGHGR